VGPTGLIFNKKSGAAMDAKKFGFKDAETVDTDLRFCLDSFNFWVFLGQNLSFGDFLFVFTSFEMQTYHFICIQEKPSS